MAEQDEWFNDVDETEEREESQSDLDKFEIMNYPADTTLKGYKDMWDNKQLKVPEFQRKYVWDAVRASKLVESFLLGLPVPGVFLYKERNKAQQLVIDGNQRIQSIVSFYQGVIRERKFTLKGVAAKWEGKSYDDLSEDEKFKLDTSVMRSTIIQQLNPDDNSSIYYIFERLNTGGMNLNPMEVRLCVSEGKLSSLLKKLNALSSWRTVINKKAEDLRFRDAELILRVFALEERLEKYEKPMKVFLNNYIRDNKDPTDAWMKEKEALFAKAISLAEQLAEKPFHIRGRLNYAALDSILVALMHNQDSDIARITKGYKELIEDPEYIEAITKNTSDNAEITKRFSLAKAAIT